LLTVSAAISLTDALEDVGTAYRASGGGEVRFNFAGSNVLARQIVNGAPVDLFVSADEAQMAVVANANAIVPGTQVELLRNRLAVVLSSSARSRSSRNRRFDASRSAIPRRCRPASMPNATCKRSISGRRSKRG
jgi:molybdate transport system substrate-binding protein